MGNQAGIIIRNVKNELFHSAKRLILNEVKGIECLLVDRIVDKLKKMRAAGDEYGKMVHRAIDYLLDDEEAFKRFLYDGHLDMHNIAIERCFRHIAIGRRNWLHTGSHQAAKNIAFMFGLLESCKLNDIDFGIYIEDVLTRIMYGEHVDDSFLPCGYVPRYKEGQDAA